MSTEVANPTVSTEPIEVAFFLLDPINLDASSPPGIVTDPENEYTLSLGKWITGKLSSDLMWMINPSKPDGPLVRKRMNTAEFLSNVVDWYHDWRCGEEVDPEYGLAPFVIDEERTAVLTTQQEASEMNENLGRSRGFEDGYAWTQPDQAAGPSQITRASQQERSAQSQRRAELQIPDSLSLERKPKLPKKPKRNERKR